MKMRVLYSSNKGKIKSIAQLITDNYATEKINCMDSIPPAYSCDKERLVVMLISVSKDPVNPLILFCKELTKARAANVAFIVDGSPEGAKIVIDAVKEAGANVVGEPLYIKGGLPFLKGVKDEEKKQVTEWMDNVISKLQ
jgi:flavodoxin